MENQEYAKIVLDELTHTLTHIDTTCFALFIGFLVYTTQSLE